MPVSILSTLVLLSALMTPGVKVEEARPSGPDRAIVRSIDRDHTSTIIPWEFQDSRSWTLSEADTEEEETSDGESEGLSSEAHWLVLPSHDLGQVSPYAQTLPSLSRTARSMILRC